jgi:hypothetical protein
MLIKFAAMPSPYDLRRRKRGFKHRTYEPRHSDSSKKYENVSVQQTCGPVLALNAARPPQCRGGGHGQRGSSWRYQKRAAFVAVSGRRGVASRYRLRQWLRLGSNARAASYDEVIE